MSGETLRIVRLTKKESAIGQLADEMADTIAGAKKT
jgi:hypothetical protein